MWCIRSCFYMRPHLYKRPCPSVRPLVGQSIGNAFVKIDKKWTFTDSKCLEQCWMMKKEG